MCPQKYGIWSQRLAGSQSSPSCSTHSSNVWKKHNVICRLKTNMIKQRQSREMYKNTAKRDPNIPGGPTHQTTGKNTTLFADWKQTWSNRDRVGRCTKIQLNWIPTYQKDHLPTPSCCSVTHTVFIIQGLTSQVVLNPPSTDYLLTMTMKFPDFSMSRQKLPFSPNFPGLEWGTSVSPHFKDGMNTKISETRKNCWCSNTRSKPINSSK